MHPEIKGALSCSGDPSGPLLFSLVLKVLTDRIEFVVPDLAVNAWYLDDGVLIGKSAAVKQALDIIMAEGEGLGLHLNLGKCELWWSTPDPHWTLFPAEIPRVTATGLQLLGGAVGGDAFVQGQLLRRVQKVVSELHRLEELEDSQTQLLLLRHCLGFAKVAYAMRTSPPRIASDPMSALDAAVTDSLQSIVGGVMSPAARAQAALPVAKGGLGVRESAPAAEAAYLSSWSATRRLQAQILRVPASDLPPTAAAVSSLAALNARSDGPAWTLEALLGQLPTQEQLLERAEAAASRRVGTCLTAHDSSRWR